MNSRRDSPPDSPGAVDIQDFLKTVAYHQMKISFVSAQRSSLGNFSIYIVVRRVQAVKTPKVSSTWMVVTPIRDIPHCWPHDDYLQ